MVSSSNEEMHLAALSCPALFLGSFTVDFITSPALDSGSGWTITVKMESVTRGLPQET